MHLRTESNTGIRYLEAGPSDISPRVTCLLIHGLGGSLEQWTDVLAGLGDDVRVIAIDVPGFGQSRTWRGKFSVDTSAQQILEFCRIKNIHHCVLVSHSVGCVIAGKLASAAPELFMKVVLVSGALVRASAIAQNPLKALRYPKLGFFVGAQFLAGAFPIPHLVLKIVGRSRLLRSMTLWPFVAHPEELQPERFVTDVSGSGSPAVLRVLFTARSIDYIAIISSVRQPVELLWGAEDPLIDEEDLDCVRRLVRVDGEHKIERCGHWPWLENPSEVIRFIRSRSVDAASKDQHL